MSTRHRFGEDTASGLLLLVMEAPHGARGGVLLQKRGMSWWNSATTVEGVAVNWKGSLFLEHAWSGEWGGGKGQ